MNQQQTRHARITPRQIDGADVLFWATSNRGLFHTIPHGSDPNADGVHSVSAMAICRYQDGDRYYLFKCDHNWGVVFDWDVETVNEAKVIAASQLYDELVEWRSAP